MAHFAKLNEDNEVIQVIVVHNNELLDSHGVEREEIGVAFCINWSGGHPFWKQTSYNRNFRKNFAGKEFTYDPVRDAFIPPKIFNSWLLNEETCTWVAPVPRPSDFDTVFYRWDEDTINWVKIEEPK